jgi:hypothetical protein
MQTPPPPDWTVEGCAFGVHDQEPEYRQRAAVASRNQQQYQTGRLVSPQFSIDDMGYGDIGPCGNKLNQTPNLDRIAREGNSAWQA